MIPLTREIKIGDEVIVVRELTVNEILAWMGEKQETQESAMEALLLKDMSLTDLTRMTDLSRERMGKFTPSQLRRVMEVCKELNPDFFQAIDNLFVMTAKMESAITSKSCAS